MTVTAQRPAKYGPFKASCAWDLATITIGALASHVRNVGVELNEARGKDPSGPVSCRAYLSDNADGSTITGTTPDTVAVGTNGLAIVETAGKFWTLITNVAGLIDLNITYNNTAHTWYLVLIKPDGGVIVSPAITVS